MAKKLDEYELDVNLANHWKKIILPFLGIVALLNSSCDSTAQANSSTTFAQHESLPSAPTELPLPEAPTSPGLELTPSELQEFDSVMLDLDPEQQLVTNITQWKLSTTVNVTTGPGFKTLSQERQNEIVTGMRDGLSQICSCSPYLKFNTEDSQPLDDINQYIQWQ
ncbi:hypothetical protein IQ260_21725 [Leptolyngbya cf. ectocarpi LEGE 11479]|uniref:Uncharacterized protein n=1 Tax=Leptolyngbya cf. ectocarpi LEGE 11479 TaxID=1828722 RepID=A0A928ZXF1_LEPEC|nr:hypothetical protein [Leptolyngbya ectocarpi]MBE9069266.1 hypothetical protein [Leptolyngbya cf. ectocarpi LEGE 11479]